MNKSLYVNIPEELWEQMRQSSFKLDVSKRDFVIAALGMYLKTINAPKPATVSKPKSITPKAIDKSTSILF